MLIHINVNGEKRKIHCAPDAMLMDVLRDDGFKSVKCGCDTTNCGLCTVLVEGVPMLACSIPAARMNNKNVTTLEGVQDEARIIGSLLVDEGADQCGFAVRADYEYYCHEKRTCQSHRGRHQTLSGRKPVPVHRLYEPAACC